MKRAAMVLICVLATRAVADDAPPPAADPEAEAHRLYDEGTAAYRVADWPEAVAKYKSAYKLVPKPLFLFNIAQAYRLAGDAKQALFFYNSYLKVDPEAFNKADAEQRMQEMQAELDKQDAARSAKPPDHVRIPAPGEVAQTTKFGAEGPFPAPHHDGGRPIYKKWWFWAGIGAVAIAAGAVVVVSSRGGGAPSSDFGTSGVFP